MILINFHARYLKKKIEQATLTTEADIADFVATMYLDVKLQNTNKKVTSEKVKHLETGSKLNNLSKNASQISITGYIYLLGRIYFTDDGAYQEVLVFTPMLNPIKLDNKNNKVTNCMSTEILPKKVKPFDP